MLDAFKRKYLVIQNVCNKLSFSVPLIASITADLQLSLNLSQLTMIRMASILSVSRMGKMKKASKRQTRKVVRILVHTVYRNVRTP